MYVLIDFVSIFIAYQTFVLWFSAFGSLSFGYSTFLTVDIEEKSINSVDPVIIYQPDAVRNVVFTDSFPVDGYV